MSDAAIGLFFIIMVASAIYLIPAIIAAAREHPDNLAIFFLNLLLGWTVLGWIIALVWSTTGIAHRKAK